MPTKEGFMNHFLVGPGNKVRLAEWDPDDHSGFKGGKMEAQEALARLTQELDSLQEVLYAEHKQKILIVLQGIDTSGKDGVIRHVFEGVNPQGVRVVSFKVPTAEELDHDYLWRIHKHTPGRGEIVVFNRSHYEDVLVVRVHNLAPEEVWRRRFDQINQFERLLTDEGTTILKFFLYISKDEQKKQLQERVDDPSKRWKFNLGDLNERKLWPKYIEAYEDVLSKTSTDTAPWYIVPSNQRWFQRYLVASVLVDKLKSLKMDYPKPQDDLSGVVIE
jgi:PPK2 family polyphosphate:nucleotide phosphotransferase